MVAATTLEEGNIYFFYRPKKAEEHPEDLADIQRMYLVLQPRRGSVRLVVLGRKLLPETERRPGERVWGFVDAVSERAEEVEDELDPRGSGQTTRPAGEGVYRLVSHDDDHTHLVYALELPQRPGPVQDELRIEPEASYILSVKNPEQPSPPGRGLEPKRKAEYPAELQARFKKLKFIPAAPELLDYAGAEVLLIGSAEDVRDELGMELPTEPETADTAEIFRELKLERDQHPVGPLFSGRWE